VSHSKTFFIQPGGKPMDTVFVGGLDGTFEIKATQAVAGPDLYTALKMAEEWLRRKTDACDRPAILDKRIMDALAKYERE
jgi:hypothetical protein